MRLLLRVSVAYALLAGMTTSARANEDGTPEALSPVMFLPVVPGRRADRELAQRFVLSLADEARKHPAIEVVDGGNGKGAVRRLQRRTRKCKRRAACLAKLARRGRARWVIASTAIRGDGGTLQMLAQVVDVQERSVLRQVTFDVTAESFDSVLAEKFVALLGVEPPVEVEIELDSELGSELGEEPAVAQADPEATDPGTTEPGTPEAPADPGVAPGEPDPTAASPEPPALAGQIDSGRGAPRSGSERGARRPAGRGVGLTAETADEGLSNLAWTGLGALGAGAVSAALGAVWVTRAQSATEVSPENDTQLGARSELDDAKDQIRAGNVALIAGGVLGLTGLTLLFLDSLEDAPTVGVAPTPGGASIRIGLEF